MHKEQGLATNNPFSLSGGIDKYTVSERAESMNQTISSPAAAKTDLMKCR
jgi:hypothetical protein